MPRSAVTSAQTVQLTCACLCAGPDEWHNEFGQLSQRIAPGATMGWAVPKACVWFEGKRRVGGTSELAGALNLEAACTA